LFSFSIFGEYFLFLMLLQCFIVGYIDSKKFISLGKTKTGTKAKYISIAFAIISLALFLIKTLN
jgi:hypothetical protein